MGEYTYDEDIDALATHLHEVRQNEGNWWCDPDSAKDWSRALTALVAERDTAIKERDEARRMISEINDENERLSDELKRLQEGGGA